MPQADINALLIERGLAGDRVVRLKGGDPFVFARGGEEARALDEAGVPYEVVPGITSAIAAPAYAGIPVTLRHSSTSFTVVTGHEDPDVGAEGSVDWDAVARVGGTIVVLMGVGRISTIASRLIAAGRSPDTPAAAVRWGTRPEQTTVRATLASIAEADLSPPATIVIGDVAAESLDWFEGRPLLGRTVVVTRPAPQADGLCRALERAGARPVKVPAVAIDDPSDGGAGLRAAAGLLDDYAWVVVTSANGADRLLDVVRDARSFGAARVAAIGPGTADALAGGNVVADLVPAAHVGEGLVEAFPDPPADRRRVLLVQAELGRPVVAEGLAEAGWDVDVVAAYRTVAGSPAPEALEAGREADIVTFTSSSTVSHYLDLMGGPAAVTGLVACIGPVTAATAREAGLDVAVVAREHSAAGLVDAVRALHGATG